MKQVDPKTALDMWPNLTYAIGQPQIYFIQRDTSEFCVRPTPDQTYIFDILCYNFSADLSGDTDTNWWTDYHWRVLLYGAMAEANEYVKVIRRKPCTGAAKWKKRLKKLPTWRQWRQHREIGLSLPQVRHLSYKGGGVIGRLDAEHSAIIVGTMVVFFGLAAFILTNQYRRIIDRLDSIDHPVDGYMTKIACKERQDNCVGLKCTERIEKMFTRIETATTTTRSCG